MEQLYDAIHLPARLVDHPCSMLGWLQLRQDFENEQLTAQDFKNKIPANTNPKLPINQLLKIGLQILVFVK